MDTHLEAPPSRAGELSLIGKELALDFANTSSGRGGPDHREHLRTAEHVLAWARHARVLRAADSERARHRIADDPALGAKLLQRALQLRETVFAIGTAIAARHDPEPAVVEQLSRTYADCVARARLIPLGAGFVWSWEAEDGLIEAILGPITLSAMALLTQADLSRVKQCGGDQCGWLFFDITKNKTRRWCEMEICGNRAKQKRFHRRRKSGKSPVPARSRAGAS